MEHKLKVTPKDFFLYLLVNMGLYYSAIALIVLWHQYINHLYPSTVYSSVTSMNSSMKWAIASLIVVFPIYVAVMHYLNKDVEATPEKREMWIRKWLIYFTLFITALTLVIDIIAVLYAFLDGELAISFALKALSILVVAGAIFSYYLFELRSTTSDKTKTRSWFRWGSLLLVLASVIGAFFVVGSPTTARLIKQDQVRVNDLSSIQWQIINYWQSKGELPVELAMLNDSISGYITPVDPATAEPYGYSVIDEKSFTLCADFNLKGAEYEGQRYPVEMISTWSHEEGRQCFNREVDEDLYPVRMK